MSYFGSFRIERFKVIDKNFILDVSKNKLIFKAKERADGVLIEFYTFHYLVSPYIDLIEDVSTHNCMYCLTLTRSNAVDCTTCLVDCLWLSILSLLWNYWDIPSANGPVMGATDQHVIEYE